MRVQQDFAGSQIMEPLVNAIPSDLWRWVIFPILTYLGYRLLKWLLNTLFSWDE